MGGAKVSPLPFDDPAWSWGLGEHSPRLGQGGEGRAQSRNRGGPAAVT